jgi:hypothetical protein
MMTREEFDRERHATFANFLIDSWGILESEIYDRLDLPGREIICEFGAGAQGIVFMTEDGGFVKVTESEREAAFAATIRDWNLPEFPSIHDVYAFTLGTQQLFAIYRESVDDYLGPFPDETLEDLVHEAMEDARIKPPSFEALDRLRRLAPHHHAEITDLLTGLDRLADRTGLRVYDLHSENIGRTDDGRVVVRDFGMNALTFAQINDAVRSIQELPDSVLELAA